MPVDQVGSGEWWVSRFRRIVVWFAIVADVGFVVLALTKAIATSGAAAPWETVVFCVLFAGVGGMLMEFFLRGAVGVVVHPDGRIDFHRPIGTFSTHAHRVTRIGRSVWNETPSRKPITLATTDGTVRLHQNFPAAAEMISAIRVHNPDLPRDP